MAIVKQCKYNTKGELLMPDPDIVRVTFAEPVVKMPPTFNPGYYHKFMFQGNGLSQTSAEKKATDRLRLFYEILNQIEGVITISLTKNVTNFRDTRNFIVVYTLVYAVENIGQDPNNLYPDYQRHLRFWKSESKDLSSHRNDPVPATKLRPPRRQRQTA